MIEAISGLGGQVLERGFSEMNAFGLMGETVLSGIFIGEIVDLAFLRDMQEKRARRNIKLTFSGLGAIGTVAISLKFGADAGGIVTAFSGLSLLVLYQRYLILKALERRGNGPI